MSWEESREKEIGILLQCVEQKFSINRETLISKSRKRELVLARRLVMNILFEVFQNDKISASDIPHVVQLDRVSFIHHRSKHLGEYESYKKYKQEYDSFKEDFISAIESAH